MANYSISHHLRLINFINLVNELILSALVLTKQLQQMGFFLQVLGGSLLPNYLLYFSVFKTVE